MKNIFKILIPKADSQEVEVQTSWTLEWKSFVHSFSRYSDMKFNAKVFTNYEDAELFRRELQKAAKFVNTSVINLKLTRND